MQTDRKINRRSFITSTATATAGLLLLSRCNYPSAFKWRYFTDYEANLLDALVEQIIPTDDWPGARDAGVANYIDKQLSGPLSRYREEYRQGLKAVQLTAKTMYNLKFEELNWDIQTQFLEQMEAGLLEGEHWTSGFQQRFFNLLLEHTMQGFYGSPRHGGNKNYVSYKMIQLDYPHIIGRNVHKV